MEEDCLFFSSALGNARKYSQNSQVPPLRNISLLCSEVSSSSCPFDDNKNVIVFPWGVRTILQISQCIGRSFQALNLLGYLMR